MLTPSDPDALAGVDGLELSEVLGVALDQVGQLDGRDGETVCQSRDKPEGVASTARGPRWESSLQSEWYGQMTYLVEKSGALSWSDLASP